MPELLQKVEKDNPSLNVAKRHDTTIDVEDDRLFLERFVFPYISGVLEHLTREGYSRIISRNSQVTTLENCTGGHTLDLR